MQDLHVGFVSCVVLSVWQTLQRWDESWVIENSMFLILVLSVVCSTCLLPSVCSGFVHSDSAECILCSSLALTYISTVNQPTASSLMDLQGVKRNMSHLWLVLIMLSFPLLFPSPSFASLVLCMHLFLSTLSLTDPSSTSHPLPSPLLSSPLSPSLLQSPLGPGGEMLQLNV